MSTTPEISQTACSAASEDYDPSKDLVRKPTRTKDPAWKYAFWPHLQDKLTIQCVLCGKNISSGYTVVLMCLKATDEIMKDMHLYMKTNLTKFKAMHSFVLYTVLVYLYSVILHTTTRY